jgi:TolB-like protein/class 3 adenylate cyclase/Flp pilus assembly protein TadD
MSTQEVKRKLAAILSADVKGYSRLMGEDEESTARTLNAYKEVMTGLIQHHHGRVVDAPGDNVLAEFGSVVDAVRCAVEIQKELKTRNAEVPENRKMEFRIGVNLGDVIEDGEKICGDGVNIAARLESLSEAGGICISGTAFDQVKNKLNIGYKYLGEQAVKNIEEPIRVYRVLMEPEGAGKVVGERNAKPRKWQKPVSMLVAILIVVAAVVVIWRLYLHSTRPPVEVASKEKMAFPLPDKPSIAVLPFVNMSKDPDQEYFSDGMTEDLITDLSKISGLMVIARNSTFTYKGKPVKIKQVAEDLGVRYVLEGSVRRAGNEIRINAQLVDALSGHHLWAERYDGKMGRIFVLQDQITQKIVSALAVKLTGTEKQIIVQKGTNNVEAYDEFLRGWVHYLRMTSDDLAWAVHSLKRATELDPNFGRAYAALALAYEMATVIPGWTSVSGVSWSESRLRVGQYLKQAMKKPTSIAHLVNANLHLYRRQHGEAVSEAERALALDPNDPTCNSGMAFVLLNSGKPKEAIDFINRAMRFDPHNPGRYLFLLGVAQFCMGNLEEAANLIEKAHRINPEFASSISWLASIYGLLGREKEARAALETHKKLWRMREFKLPATMYFFPFKDRADADRIAEGMVKAGIPGPPSGYFPTFKENQLTGEEIKRLNFGRTVTGIDPDGFQWWLDKKKNGELTLRVPGARISSDTGKTRIDGNMECVQFQKIYWGLEYCMTNFRNPRGTYEGKDEYFSCNDFGFIPWSVVR